MAHPQEIREKLRRLYVSGEQTLETAALMCEIPQATARAWKRADKEKATTGIRCAPPTLWPAAVLRI